MLMSVNLTDISGGNILILLGIIAGILALYRASPIGSDAVDSWKNLAEGRKQELQEAQADARNRFDQAERLKAELQTTRLALARCEEQPKTEDLAAAIREMSAGFQTHRGELIATQKELFETMNRILGHLEKSQETQASMHQALIVLVDRNRDQRNGDSDDPPVA
jgi:hypothetical protein